VEPRYLSPLLPLNAVAVAGVMCRMIERAPRRWLAMAPPAVAVLAVLILVKNHRGLAWIPEAARSANRPCDRALAFLRDAEPEGPILTSNPWAVSWELDRGAVQAPSNGPRATVAVAKHYGTAWALVGMPAVLGVDLGSELARGRARRELSAKSAFRDGACEVYRLRGVVPASAPSGTVSTRVSQNDQKLSSPMN
jgi:hypothetical protein